jgi:hypothetical protein
MLKRETRKSKDANILGRREYASDELGRWIKDLPFASSRKVSLSLAMILPCPLLLIQEMVAEPTHASSLPLPRKWSNTVCSKRAS